MMKLLSLSALAGVLAADMPVFSSNDDYDEINLNIRLLKGHNGTEEGPNPNKTYHVVKTEMKTKYTTDLTHNALCSAVQSSTVAALQTAIAGAKAQVENCGDSSMAYPDHDDHDHRKLQATGQAEKTEKEVKQQIGLIFEDPASAAAGAGVVNGADFSTTFGAVLATELAKDASLSAAVGAPTVTGVSKAGVTVFKGDKEVTTAPTVSPAPAPATASSDASMLKVNVALAAVAAVFASMF